MDNVFKGEPVPLRCPCGLPLQVAETTDGKWAIGHFNKTCSPIVWDEDPGKVLLTLIQEIRKGTYGNKRQLPQQEQE